MSLDLSICVINHKTPALTQQCVQSILDTCAGLGIEVFVVNNTHDDAEFIAALTRRDQRVQVLQNAQPLGFSANQNQMLSLASGRYLMPLNSDTMIQPGALRELVEFMQAHPNAGLCGPRLVFSDGRLQPSCRNFPTPLTHFLEASGLVRFLKGSRAIGKWYYLAGSHDQPREVDWLTGACLIVRASAARQVGFYNADLFSGLYGEDLEWCWRMRQAGWQVLFDPQAVVVHLESQSPLSDRTLLMYRGFYTFCARYYSRSKQRGIRGATILALLPRWLLALNKEKKQTFAQLMRLPMSSPGL
ncbi:MAG TPA: glycosyltransferase family 2 protein [Anaerolineae bacterium]